MTTTYDFAIVGAGAAGLTAGYELVRRGFSVTILEASSRWGGRVMKVDEFADFPLDIGGSWIHENSFGRPFRRILDEIVNNPSTSFDNFPSQAQQLDYFYFEDGNRVKEYYESINDVWIGTTWFDFLEAFIHPWVADVIIYDCAVETIDYASLQQVRLDCSNGQQFQAKQVIVTASAQVLREELIAFDPSLPREKLDILTSNEYEWVRAFKGFMKFTEPFYENEQSFEIFPPYDSESSNKDYVIYFWDATDQQGSSQHILGVIIEELYLDNFESQSNDEILAFLLNHLDSVYEGRPSELYLQSTFMNWANELFIQGGWSESSHASEDDYFNDYFALTIPLGKSQVYFAGEYIAHDGYYGTVDGAARSGQTQACIAIGGSFTRKEGCIFPLINSFAPAPVPVPPPAFCFSGETEVELVGNVQTPMKNLKVGDWVKVTEGRYEQVYTFGHWDPEVVVNYLRITTNASSTLRPLELSQNHMLFILDNDKRKSVPASMLQVGTPLWIESKETMVVHAIETVTRNGAFAPFTSSGKLLVNGGIVASNYVTMQDHRDQLFIGEWKTPFSYQWLAHSFQAHQRLWYQFVTRERSEMKVGISGWVNQPYALSKWWLSQKPWTLALILLPLLSYLAIISTLETVVMIHPLLLILLFVVITLVVTLTRRKQRLFP